MSVHKTEIRGKRVAVVGAGREGMSSAKWLQRHGADITVLDRLPRTKLARQIRDLKKVGITDWRFGPKYLDDLKEFDIVVRTPLRPYLSPEIQRAVKAGVTVTSQMKLFFERCPAKIVGVTGTKGKGTTSSLIAAMLKQGKMRVHLGGNIGKPGLDFLDRVKPSDIVVLELSSYQLQDLDRSPRIAVVTNVTEDHLDYHGTVREYRAAKRPITKFQRKSDLVILNADDPGSKQFAKDAGKVRWFSTRKFGDGEVADGWLRARGKRVIRAEDLKVPGEHNRQNALAAALAAEALGVGRSPIAEAVRRFRGLKYHLEYIGTKGGVRYFNDSYATNQTATIPAIESIDTPLGIILGGTAKGLDFGKLANALARREVRAIVLIPPAADQIATAMANSFQRAGKKVPPQVSVTAPSQIVQAINKYVEPGDTVLFSPAASSKNWFHDYTDRGRYFTEQVKRLQQ